MAVLTNATGARWSDEGPIVEMSAFGGKLMLPEPLAAAAALLLKRPVRVAFTRMEDFAAANPAPGSWHIVIDWMGDLSSQANVGRAKSPGMPKISRAP